jgi:anaerobic ribonucleoside-triphosphate reductase activating protein
MKFITVTSPDVNNGPGFRTTLWVAGCSHKCKGCNNPESWRYAIGFEYKQIKDKLYTSLNNSYITGLTLSGGDPLDQSNWDLIKLYFIVRKIKKDFPNKTIWLYTGFTLEEAMKNRFRKAIIKLCDVIVDGPYKKNLRDTTLEFRGSSNQRITAVKDIL